MFIFVEILVIYVNFHRRFSQKMIFVQIFVSTPLSKSTVCSMYNNVATSAPSEQPTKAQYRVYKTILSHPLLYLEHIITNKNSGLEVHSVLYQCCHFILRSQSKLNIYYTTTHMYCAAHMLLYLIYIQ